MSWMIGNQGALRDNAQRNRNRGLHTGKSAAGWTFKRPDPERGTFDRVRAEAKAALTAHWSSVLADYQAAVYGWDEIPF